MLNTMDVMEDFMEEKAQQVFRDYFAGASIAFGIPFLALEIMGVLYGGSARLAENIDDFILVILVLHIIGGLVGGFLVARKRQKPFYQIAVITGVFAYILEQIIYSLFFLRLIGETYNLITLIAGSLIGSFFGIKNLTKRTTDDTLNQSTS
jgi:uncharacterized protein YneF (UPF0154 family)